MVSVGDLRKQALIFTNLACVRHDSEFRSRVGGPGRGSKNDGFTSRNTG